MFPLNTLSLLKDVVRKLLTERKSDSAVSEDRCSEITRVYADSMVTLVDDDVPSASSASRLTTSSNAQALNSKSPTMVYDFAVCTSLWNYATHITDMDTFQALEAVHN